MGQLGQKVKDLERRLDYRRKIGQLDTNEVQERYVTGYLRLLNALLSRLRRVLGQQIRPCCAFDHSDSRDWLKNEAEFVRLLPQVVSETQSRYLELERKKVKDSAKANNEGRRKKSEEEELRKHHAKPVLPDSNFPAPGLPVVIDAVETLEEEWRGIVEEMAGPEVEMASGEAGGEGASEGEAQMNYGNEGVGERESGEAAESDQSSRTSSQQLFDFPPSLLLTHVHQSLLQTTERVDSLLSDQSMMSSLYVLLLLASSHSS